MALLLENDTEDFEDKQLLSDYQLAIQLQEQFQKELQTENPGINLTYNKKSIKNSKNESRSLVDPSWEVIDPTPNIHELFVTFNERFFWNKLLPVCVSWSNRMTSCAGICSFQGGSGLCRITLSAPLLKLRPRKNLVETLLHEMIHAYLFLTLTKRDREDHGPEFHKHMYRINKEAGTNITVYHDFHDEVRLYKQHWWKCNGPCQHRKPYFGLVKRAMNRAPGPNDLWWADHMNQCGGIFTKIKEPEKPKKQSDKKSAEVVKKKTSPSNDIRNFLDQPNELSNKKTTLNNIIQQSNTSSLSTSTYFNNNNTPYEVNNTNKTTETSRNDDYSTCRNYWLSKYPDGNIKKRPLPQDENTENKIKSPKIVQSVSKPQLSQTFSKSKQSVFKPKKVARYIPKNEDDLPGLKKCFICGQRILDENFERHVMMCAENTYDFDAIDIPTRTNTSFIDLTESDDCIVKEIKKECSLCGIQCKEKDFETHTEQCLLRICDNLEEKYNFKTEN